MTSTRAQNALLLIAGTGSRLKPLTDDRPKCLVELGGKPLLAWQLQSLKSAGVQRVAAVTGYRRESLAPWLGHGIDREYVNERFETTNMVATLLRAEEELARGLIISYGDIIYSPQVVETLQATPGDIAVVVDRRWHDLWKQRFRDPLSDAETLMLDPEGRILEIGQKPSSLAKVMAQYIGLIKLTPEGGRRMLASYRRAEAVVREGGLAWGRVRSLEKAYMTDLLQGLIDEGQEIRSAPIDGQWLEMDSMDDYALYERLGAPRADASAIFNLGR
jgi:choline kinase